MSDPLSARVAKLEKAAGTVRFLFASSSLPGDLEAKHRQAEELKAAGARVVLVVSDVTPCGFDR